MQNNDIIIRIRTSLKKKGMTQRDLAAMLNKNEAEVSRWMSGRMGISEANLQKIETVLETPLSNTSIAKLRPGYLKIGVVGTGSIARRFADEVAYVSNVYLAAAYNPDKEQTYKFCEFYGIETEAKTIDELIDEVDAVYVASPYYTHYEYVIKSLNAGKHVLCETPITKTLQEAQEIYAIAEKKGLVFMPALKTAYCPSFYNIIEESQSGEIGEIVDVSATVTTLLSQKETVGFNNERMRDNANYALLAILKILGIDIRKISAFTRKDDCKDMYLNATIEYEEAVAHLKAGTGVKSESSLVISGTKGYIYVPAPWWKPDYFEIRHENPNDNRKLYFPYESSGLRYETQSFVDNVFLKSSQQSITKKEILKITQIVDKFLR